MTPENFQQRFISYKKYSSTTWRDSAFESRNYSEEWIKILDISDFQSLKKLIVTGQIKRKLPIKIRDHFVDIKIMIWIMNILKALTKKSLQHFYYKYKFYSVYG